MFNFIALNVLGFILLDHL